MRIPHMGWNSLTRIKPAKLLANLDAQPFTYFAHSYYAPLVDATAATCLYLNPYSALLERKMSTRCSSIRKNQVRWDFAL